MPTTNRERINAMSNEELAEFLGDSSLCRICLYSHNENCLHETCKQGILQWLNQESEESYVNNKSY